MPCDGVRTVLLALSHTALSPLAVAYKYYLHPRKPGTVLRDCAEADTRSSPCSGVFCCMFLVMALECSEAKVPCRRRCHLGPSVWWKRKTLGYVHIAAAADVAGLLQGVQERPQLGRDSRVSNAPWVVGREGDADRAEHRLLEGGWHCFEPRAGRASWPFDVEASA